MAMARYEIRARTKSNGTTCIQHEFLRRASLEQLVSQQDQMMKTKPRMNYPLSIIDRMPVEIAAHIFKFYVDIGVGLNCSPIILGAVSQAWRRLVWSTPNLWTTLALIFQKPAPITKSLVALVQDWLGRSRPLPLRLIMYTDAVDHQPEFYPLIDVVNQHSSQWYSLELALPNDLLSRLDDRAGPASMLHDLSMSSTVQHLLHADGPRGPLINTGAPTTLRIDGAFPGIWHLRFENVTRLCARYVFVDQILQVLQLAPSLQHCEFDEVWNNPLFLRTGDALPITNTSLKSLKIIFYLAQGEFAKDLFGNVSLPALEDLNYVERDCELGVGLTVDELVSFLTRSRCPLKTLTVQGEMWKEDFNPLENLAIVGRAAGP